MTSAVILRRALLVSAALTLLLAAGLVLHLQRDSARRHQEQTRAVVEQLCRQTAMLVAERVRENFGAAVFETLEGIGHPELRNYELPRIALFFDSGRHLYVDRFFIWSEQMRPARPGEVVFYRRAGETPGDTPIIGVDGQPRGSLYAQPDVGEAIWAHANRLYPRKRSFALVEDYFGGRPYQIVIHYIWEDERRHGFTALVGYTVDLTYVRAGLFGEMFPSGRPAVPDAERFDLSVSIRDDRGVAVLGTPPVREAPSASEPLDMLFYPSRSLRPWLATEPPAVPWTITVSAPSPALSTTEGGYWLFAAVVFLILIGLVCAVTLDRQSRRLSEMQSEFVANVSHQLKTPLALLSGAAETLGRGRITSPEKLREYAGIVHAQTARLSSLVEQAIVFAVADRNGSGLHIEIVDVSSLVRDVVDGFRSGVPKELQVQFSAEEAVPFVKANAAALEQVVWNLLENAVKYGQPTNAIAVSVRSRDGEAVVVVRDQGDGITEDDLPHIFDRFYRSRQHATRRGGFGLGLAYVQKVIAAHGGRVSVSSAPGQGSEFRVHLPAA